MSLNLLDKSLASACGACISLAAVSAAMKFVDDNKQTLGKPDPKIRESLKPVLITDVSALKPQ
jgi:pyocin large subunit-like protein